MSRIRLRVVPDAWSGLASFDPQEPCGYIVAGTITAVRISSGAIVTRERAEDLKRLAWLGLVDAHGNPVPAVPAGTDVYGNTYRGGIVR